MYWPIIDLIAGLFYSDIKIIRNIVSCSHAVSSCILYAVNKDRMMINSLTYFVWDTLYILEQKNVDWMLLWHHLISNYLLLVRAPNNYIKERILFTLELSNLPTYVVYHMLKLEKDVRLVRVFQFIWSCYFRVYIMTNIIINNILDHDSDITILLVCLIYIIGINFNICILKQITKNFLVVL